MSASASHHDHSHDDHVCEGELMNRPVVAIIGLGLIGASFAAALKQANSNSEQNIVDRIIGVDNDETAISYCREQGYIDATAESAAAAAAHADIVVLAVPVPALSKVVSSIAPALREGTVIMDVASVKGEAVEAITPHLPQGVDFVPAHPIAGKATSGASSADAGLFKEKLVILTPDKDKTRNRAIAAVNRLWEAAGSRVERMSAPNHDIIYGYVSHLPQIMAFAACKTLAETEISESYTSGPAFSRFIRLGASSPALWQGIVQANREPIRHALGHVLATLDHMLEEFEDGKNKGKQSSQATADTLTRHFPLLASAALISVITQFEMQNEIRLAPYSGSGFRDFIAPAGEDPNADMEAISKAYAPVAVMLTRFRDHLLSVYVALADVSEKAGDTLESLFSEGVIAYGHITSKAD